MHCPSFVSKTNRYRLISDLKKKGLGNWRNWRNIELEGSLRTTLVISSTIHLHRKPKSKRVTQVKILVTCFGLTACRQVMKIPLLAVYSFRKQFYVMHFSSSLCSKTFHGFFTSLLQFTFKITRMNENYL